MKQSEECAVWVAAAVRDAAGTAARPGAVAVRGGRILASGETSEVLRQAGAKAQVFHLPDRLLLPAMVNAHAHLELTPLGPRPYTGSFLSWFEHVLAGRAARDEAYAGGRTTAVAAAIHSGAQASFESGVGFVGDICAESAAAGALKDSGLGGVAYLELVGIGGDRLAETMRKLDSLVARPAIEATNVFRAGLEPHAPFSTGPEVYQRVAAMAQAERFAACTHLAETLDEVEFVATAKGAWREMLRRMGRWEDSWASFYGRGLHPVDWMRPHLEAARWLLAHCNYIEDRHLDVLVRVNASVAYCPVASAYFRHPSPGHPPHRYREMIEAGVNVCLGTDSILCQPLQEAQPLGILPQMRFLCRRDKTDADVLLRMATINGLRALGLEENLATFKPGTPARMIAVKIDPDHVADPLVQAMLNSSPAEPVHPAAPPGRD